MYYRKTSKDWRKNVRQQGLKITYKWSVIRLTKNFSKATIKARSKQCTSIQWKLNKEGNWTQNKGVIFKKCGDVRNNDRLRNC